MVTCDASSTPHPQSATCDHPEPAEHDGTHDECAECKHIRSHQALRTPELQGSGVSLPEATETPDDTSVRPLAAPDSSVRPRLTVKRRSKRPRKDVETMEFIGAVRRFLRAAGRRAADADEFELAALLSIQEDLDAAIQTAIDGQRARGRSWAYIGQAAGMNRVSAYQRWSKQ